MNNKRIGIVVLVSVVVVGLGIVGWMNYGGNRNGQGGPPVDGTKSFVVAIPTYPGFAVPYLAEKLGLFEGVNVKLLHMDDAAAINAGLIRGDIDACFTSVDAFVLAASQGVEAKAVLLSDESRGADGIVAKSAIKSVSDLKGKKVAANLGWPGHFFLLYNLKKAGIPFDDVPITNMDADKAGAAFVGGNLDAAVTWEPWLSKATSEGDAHILISTATEPGVILDVMLVTADTLTKRPKAVQAFVDGYYRALEAYSADKAGAGAIMAKALGLPAEDFDAMSEGFRFIPAEEAATLLEPESGNVAKLFKAASEIWLNAKVIEQPVSTEARITNEFVEGFLSKK